MKIDVLTLFPEVFTFLNSWSIIGRAVQSDLVSINAHNIRDYSIDKHKKVDDYPYGGGHGMVMMPQPVVDCIEAVKTERSYVICLSPKGRTLTQDKLLRMANESHLVLLCGHYEGLDQRIIDHYVDEELSIGDYVLTGGELPAMIFIDGVVRLLPGVLSTPMAFEEESHYSGLLEHPQYTRPQVFRGLEVPEVLVSGHHANIQAYQEKESLRLTYLQRPDLLEKIELNEIQKNYLQEIKCSLERREPDGFNQED